MERIFGRRGRRQRGAASSGGDSVIRTAITEAAFDAIAKTMPLGSVGYEDGTNEKDERLIWLAPHGEPAAGNARSERELQRCDPQAGGCSSRKSVSPAQRFSSFRQFWCKLYRFRKNQ
jgi:hypothetical protein